MLNSVFFSPSGIVQVEKKSFVSKLGKNLIVMSVHVTCNRGSKHLQKCVERCIVIVRDLLVI